jgi:hypothetical protein
LGSGNILKNEAKHGLTHEVISARFMHLKEARRYEEVSQMDLFVTARNLLITHFLMIYFWAIGSAVYLLQIPHIF